MFSIYKQFCIFILIQVLEHASDVLKTASVENVGTIDSVLKKMVQYKEKASNKI